MKSSKLQWLSVVVIALIGVVHLLMVPQEYDEVPYMGLLFGLNFIAAVVAAIGIYRQANWGWLLGVSIAIGSVLGYTLSRTVGLPGMDVEEWLQPLGVLSLVIEALFILLAFVKKPWASLTGQPA